MEISEIRDISDVTVFNTVKNNVIIFLGVILFYMFYMFAFNQICVSFFVSAFSLSSTPSAEMFLHLVFCLK